LGEEGGRDEREGEGRVASDASWRAREQCFFVNEEDNESYQSIEQPIKYIANKINI
jgi:hypothetical protein